MGWEGWMDGWMMAGTGGILVGVSCECTWSYVKLIGPGPVQSSLCQALYCLL